MKLIELNQKLNELYDNLEVAETLEDDAYEKILKDEWNSLKEQREGKIRAFCFVYKDLKARAESIKTYATERLKRAKALENQANGLLKFLQSQLAPREEFECPEHRIAWRKSERCIISDAQVPEQYLKPQPPKIDVAGIKKDLKAGAKLEFAKLVENLNMSIK